jgi:hypothetical protein
MTSYIDKVTLECLTNYKQQTMKSDSFLLDKKEMKFYRKRIIGLVKDLLYDDAAVFTRIESDFINNCIDHFKIQDQTDLFQKEFADLDPSLISDKKDTEIKEYVSQDKLLMRSKKVNMDSFVKRSGVQKPIMPQRREVDLTNPELRTKGLEQKIQNTDNVDKKENDNEEKEKHPVIYAENEKKNTKKKKKTTKLFVEIG